MCFSAAVIIKAKHILSVYNTSVVGGGGGGGLGTLYLCMYRHAFKDVTNLCCILDIYNYSVVLFFKGSIKRVVHPLCAASVV